MTAPKNPKRNHHHVWQAYLKPWTTDNQVWCLIDQNVSRKRTKVVAVDRDFYQLHRLTSDDFSLLKTFIAAGSPGSRRTNQQLLDMLMTPYRLVENTLNLSPAAQAAVDRYSYEILEDYHSKIENSFAPLLAKARQGDMSFYSDESCVRFINYICTQFMRTKGIKEKFFKKMEETGGPDFSRVWNILIHMFATNIGAGLYVERHKRVLQLLENTSDVPFITGDQPIVNLESVAGQAPERLSLYYPISPRMALVWGEVDEPPMKTSVSAVDAQNFNAKVKNASYLELFGDSREALLKV